MSIAWIHARMICDDCGRWFEVDIDTGADVLEGWDLVDVAVDATRGGHVLDYQGHKQGDIMRSCSVQDGRVLCGDCTASEDGKHPDPEDA
jgi:hypothetical protein